MVSTAPAPPTEIYFHFSSQFPISVFERNSADVPVVEAPNKIGALLTDLSALPFWPH